MIANPDTNLYLQGRAPTATPRGLTAVHALLDAGVNVAAGSDNLQDLFNPLGKGDPLEAAGADGARRAPCPRVEAVSSHSRRAMAIAARRSLEAGRTSPSWSRACDHGP